MPGPRPTTLQSPQSLPSQTPSRASCHTHSGQQCNPSALCYKKKKKCHHSSHGQWYSPHIISGSEMQNSIKKKKKELVQVTFWVTWTACVEDFLVLFHILVYISVCVSSTTHAPIVPQLSAYGAFKETQLCLRIRDVLLLCTCCQGSWVWAIAPCPRCPSAERARSWAALSVVSPAPCPTIPLPLPGRGEQGLCIPGILSHNVLLCKGHRSSL